MVYKLLKSIYNFLPLPRPSDGFIQKVRGALEPAPAAPLPGPQVPEPTPEDLPVENQHRSDIAELRGKYPYNVFAADSPLEMYCGLEQMGLPNLRIYKSFEEYQSTQPEREKLRQIRSDFEMSLLGPTQTDFALEGYCVLCKSSKNFSVDYLYAYERSDKDALIPNWRESLVCETCRLNNRMRVVIDLLENQVGIKSDDALYATEQVTAFYLWLSGRYQNVVGSEFLGDELTGGESYNSIRHEDATKLSFEDNSLDGILSFDVLEHVPDYKAALAEFVRCLRPGGFALISAPFASNDFSTIVRAEVSDDGSIRHLLEPEYHGNPTKPDEGSLCFYHFGWDFLDHLVQAGASNAAVLSYYSHDRGNLGNEQLFFLANT